MFQTVCFSNNISTAYSTQLASSVNDMKRQNEDSSRAMHTLILAENQKSFPIKNQKKRTTTTNKNKQPHTFSGKEKVMQWDVKTEILHADWLTSLHRYFVLLIIHKGKFCNLSIALFILYSNCQLRGVAFCFNASYL